jgi:phosphoribosyl-dephospho-CoA transferase
MTLLCSTCRARPRRKGQRNCLLCHAKAQRKRRAKTVRVDIEYLKKLEQNYHNSFHAWPAATD